MLNTDIWNSGQKHHIDGVILSFIFHFINSMKYVDWWYSLTGRGYNLYVTVGRGLIWTFPQIHLLTWFSGSLWHMMELCKIAEQAELIFLCRHVAEDQILIILDFPTLGAICELHNKAFQELPTSRWLIFEWETFFL